MPPNIEYRLDQYKISMLESMLRWQGHTGLAAYQEGPCFLRGQILLLASADYRQHGFLKGEFLDRLATLPPWRRTAWYGRVVDVRRSRDGRPVTPPDLRCWAQPPGGAPDRVESGPRFNEGVYRLERFEIVVAPRTGLRWRLPARCGRMRSGPAAVMDGILFLGPEDDRDDLDASSNTRFQSRWRVPPPWEATLYYTQRLALYACADGQPWDLGRASASAAAAGESLRSSALMRPPSRLEAIAGPSAAAHDRRNRWLRSLTSGSRLSAGALRAPAEGIRKRLGMAIGLLITTAMRLLAIWNRIAGPQQPGREHRRAAPHGLADHGPVDDSGGKR